MKRIFDATEINNLKLKNRLFRSATWEALANEDGTISEEQLKIYADLARGGIAAIITGGTDVSPSGHVLENSLMLYDDRFIDPLKKLTAIVKENDCRILTQLFMGAFIHNRRVVDIDHMSEQEIQQVIKLFTSAATRAEAAGFNGVQIHVAHGFYLSRFVSPLYNHRTDEYGRTQAGRTKIVADIITVVKKKTPQLHISAKINASDFMPGGLTPELSLEMCKILSDNGVDSIEVSANGTSRTGVKPYVNEAYFAEFAAKLKILIDEPVILVGGNRSIENMNRLANEMKIDYFSMSRPLIKEPDLVKRWLAGDEKPSGCNSCNGCYRTYGKRCIFNK